MTAPSCATCRWGNAKTGRCGAFDMPEVLARARPLLCGPAGADHAPPPDPFWAWVESWWFIGPMLVLVLATLFLAIWLGR